MTNQAIYEDLQALRGSLGGHPIRSFFPEKLRLIFDEMADEAPWPVLTKLLSFLPQNYRNVVRQPKRPQHGFDHFISGFNRAPQWLLFIRCCAFEKFRALLVGNCRAFVIAIL